MSIKISDLTLGDVRLSVMWGELIRLINFKVFAFDGICASTAKELVIKSHGVY